MGVTVLGIAVSVVLLPAAGGRKPPSVSPTPTLEITERVVRPGDIVGLGVKGAQNYIWGVATSLEAARDGEREAIYYWSTWADRASERIKPFPAGGQIAFPAVGFKGDALFRIEIPPIGPGEYLISRTFIRDDTGSINDRMITAAVQLTILG